LHNHSLDQWQVDHTFGQDVVRAGESRTRWVAALTVVTMAAEIAAGLVFGSMALLADGLHMGSHAIALGISLFAYAYARKHARNPRFSFGTGKVNALGGFTGALVLGGFSLLMVVESAERILHPVAISYTQAIVVAGVGLAVNVASAALLMGDHGHDHNLRSAYLHVIADALTSVLAIAALLAARAWGAVWMDPLMGVLGACLILKWAWGLVRKTSAVLLDEEGPERLRTRIYAALQTGGDQIADYHCWSIAPGQYAAIVSLVTHEPKPTVHYKALLAPCEELVHVNVEVHQCCEDAPFESRTGGRS
jgi:cation diffusion facilitator family transporter